MPRSLRSFILSGIVVGLLLAACGSPATPAAPEPVTPANPRSAAVNEIINIVEARPSSAETFAPATIGFTVGTGGQVQTGVESKARLDFSDGSIVRLAPTSSFILQGFATSDGQSVRHLQLLFGKIWASLLGGALEIETPVGVATVRGSFAVFQYAPGDPGDPDDDLLVVDCLEGSCAAGNATGIVQLGNLERLALNNKGSLKQTLTAADVGDFLRNNPESLGLAATLTAAPPATDTPPPPAATPTHTATAAPPTETSPPPPTATATAPTPAQAAVITPPTFTPPPTLNVAILGQHIVRAGETLNCIGRGTAFCRARLRR